MALTSRPLRPLGGPVLFAASRAVPRPGRQRRGLVTGAAGPPASDPRSRVQVYTSRSQDPYLNLSIEHHLLQRSHPDSTVLFLYTNRPSVVVGRNQNPWLEVDVGLLRRGLPAPGPDDDDAAAGPGRAPVDLVRRRSGGGAVFHDEGNTNYSVICPPAAFDRDRHAEMVVRALRALGVPGARVNARHDIVAGGGGGGGDFKVSGSAYKLTRLRSLHHGTCLLASPNLARIGPLLRSPAGPYVKARGVESVRSPVRNVGVPRAAFEEAVVRAFAGLHGGLDVRREVGEAELAVEEVRRGYEELKSLDWVFAQTPQFTFSTHPTEADPRERPPPPADVPSDFRADLTIRHGLIQEASVSGLPSTSDISRSLANRYLHQITDWRAVFAGNEPVGRWFNRLFGNQPI